MEPKVELDFSTMEMSLDDQNPAFPDPDRDQKIVQDAESNYDKLLRIAGSPGRYQLWISFILFFGIIIASMSDYATIFYGSPPKATYCKIPEHHVRNRIVPECLFWGNDSVGAERETVDYTLAEIDQGYCRIIISNGTLGETDEQKQRCRGWPCPFEVVHKFNHPREWTVISQWGLACDFYWKFTASTAIYFCGAVLGYLIFDTLGKRFGFKSYLMIRLVFIIALCVGFGFEKLLWLFVLMRFLLGAMSHAVKYSCTRLLFDLMPSDSHRMVIVGQAISSSAGIVFLGIGAYAIKDWRFILYIAGVLASVAALLSFNVTESLRWLLCRSETLQAQQVFYKFLAGNRQFVPQGADQKVVDAGNLFVKGDQSRATLRSLLANPSVSRPFFSLFGLWAIVNVVHNGVLLSIPTLGGSVYLNVVMAGLMEIMGILLVVWASRKYALSRIVFFTMFVGGIFCLVAGFIPEFDADTSAEIARTALLLFGVGFIGTCNSSLYELYFRVVPLSARWSSFGLFGAVGLIGTVLSSLLSYLIRYNKEAGFVLLGLMAVCASCLSFSMPTESPVRLSSSHPHRSISPEFIVADDEELVFEQLPEVESRSPYVMT